MPLVKLDDLVRVGPHGLVRMLRLFAYLTKNYNVAAALYQDKVTAVVAAIDRRYFQQDKQYVLPLMNEQSLPHYGSESSLCAYREGCCGLRSQVSFICLFKFSICCLNNIADQHECLRKRCPTISPTHGGLRALKAISSTQTPALFTPTLSLSVPACSFIRAEGSVLTRRRHTQRCQDHGGTPTGLISSFSVSTWTLSGQMLRQMRLVCWSRHSGPQQWALCLQTLQLSTAL